MFCQRFITCYLFYIYFILWKWCYRKSKFQRFSYLNSKWVVKQWKQVATPTTHLAQERLMIMQCTSGSRSFAKETSLEDEQRSGWASEVYTNWERHPNWSSYNLRRRCWTTRHQPFYSRSAFEAKWKAEKARWVSVSRADWTSEKSLFWSAVFSYSTQQWTISSSDCWHATKNGFYVTTGDDQLNGWTEKKLQSTSRSQTCTKKKVVVTTVWWSAAHLIHYSFLNPGETFTSENYA